MSRRIFERVLQTPVTTVIERPSQYTSNSRTPPATTKAPGQGKMIGIQAGASSRTQVTRPGAASNSRAPNWCIAWSKADGGRMPGASAMGAGLVCRNTGECPWLVFSMENMKHFDGPTFEADVLQASNPVVVDFYADWCGPVPLMAAVVEQRADEYAGKVTIRQPDEAVNQENA